MLALTDTVTVGATDAPKIALPRMRDATLLSRLLVS